MADDSKRNRADEYERRMMELERWLLSPECGGPVIWRRECAERIREIRTR